MSDAYSILIILIPLLTAILGSYLTYFLTSRSKRKEAIIRFKEEKYSKLLIKLQGFVGETASAQLKKEFIEEQYQSWIYSSDEVVKAINNLINLVIDSRGKQPDRMEGRKAVGNIVLAIRKDLLGKTKLQFTDFQYVNVHE
jgi:hypothetical protein